MSTIRLFIKTLFIVLILLISIVLFDLGNYDSSYINKSSLTFSVNNLNSKIIKRIFLYYNNLYHKIGFKISKKHQEYWKIDSESLREKFP